MPLPEPSPPIAHEDGVAPSGAGTSLESATYLGLARLAPRWILSASTRDLYRQLSQLIGVGPDSEFLLVPSGRGVAVQYLAEVTGAVGAGVDPDPELVELAVSRAREAGIADRVQYESGELADLPYQDEVFDLAIGEVGLGALGDLERGINELVRVTRPHGTVVLIQFTWTGPADPARRSEVARLLGIRPPLLVECKKMLRAAGVVDLHVEDWTETGGGRHQGTAGALAQVGTLMDRALLLWRAWRSWGAEGISGAVSSRAMVYDLIVRERVLALSVIKGTRWMGEKRGLTE